MAFLDATVVNIALPTIGKDLHTSLAGLQWTVTAYTLTLAGLILLGGSLGDRMGRRRIFTIGVAWFALASALCGLAPTIGVLIGARVLQGIGGALLTPGSLAIIQATFAPDDRPKAVGAWSGLGGVAGAAGPLLGGWIVADAGWRWVFLLNLPLAVVVLAVTIRHVPESSDPDAHGGFDVAGAGLAALSLTGITYALIEAPAGSGPAGPVAAAVIAVAAAIAFVRTERRRGRPGSRVPPMLPLDVFGSRQFTAVNVVTLLVYGAFGGMLFLLVLQLQLVVGFSPLASGLALLPTTVLMLAAVAARRGARAAHRAALADDGGYRDLRGWPAADDQDRGERVVCDRRAARGGRLRARAVDDRGAAHCHRAGQRRCPARRGGQRSEQHGRPGRRAACGGGPASRSRARRRRLSLGQRVQQRIPGRHVRLRRVAGGGFAAIRPGHRQRRAAPGARSRGARARVPA